MGAARKDVSGVFDEELGGKRRARPAALDQVFQLGPKGMTFVTDTRLPQWTEVGVEMRLPNTGARKDQPVEIDCRGVVVQCVRRERGQGFEVALLFLDLSKRAQAQLLAAPPRCTHSSISIAR